MVNPNNERIRYIRTLIELGIKEKDPKLYEELEKEYKTLIKQETRESTIVDEYEN